MREAGSQASRLEGTHAAPAAPTSEDAARTSGRGFLLITGAKLWFLVMGMVVTIGLPLLMTPADFGIYNLVTNAGGLLNMVILTATLQAVSKLVSERPHEGARVVRRASLIQLFLGVPLALAFIVGSPWLAEAFADPNLAPLLAISGGVTLCYCFYAILIGYLNGRKAFGRQALMDVSFSTLKSAATVGLVLLAGVSGALWGFVGTAAAMLLMVAVLAWRFERAHPASPPTQALPSATDAETAKRLVTYILWVMLYTFCTNGVLRADLFLLQSLLGASLQEGQASVAHHLSGIYGAMQYISRLPFQAVIAVTFVVFPMLSQATFEQDQAAVRAYIRSTLRYSLILLALLSALITGNGLDIILSLYGPAYQEGFRSLLLMGLATVGYALFFISTTMITGSGRPAHSAGLSTIALFVTVSLNFAFIKLGLANGTQGAELGVLASAATSVAMLVGCAAALLYLWKHFRGGVPLPTLARTLLASGLCAGFGLLVQLPEDTTRLVRALSVAGKGVVGAALFVGVLWALREFTDEDRQRLARVLRRKRT